MKPATRTYWKKRLWPHLKNVVSTLVFVWFFTQHIAQATMVPTESMVPTILVGDHFLLDKVAFPANYPKAVQRLLPERTIHRGDILVFRSPEDPDRQLVKRVIAIPGDILEIREGDLHINGEKLDEPYVVHNLPSSLRPVAPVSDIGPIRIPSDSFFMMGDNRDNSRDSRYFGLVRRPALIGKPLFIYWSYQSAPYPDGGGTVREWAEYYASVAMHFLTRTRWSRTGAILQ